MAKQTLSEAALLAQDPSLDHSLSCTLTGRLAQVSAAQQGQRQRQGRFQQIRTWAATCGGAEPDPHRLRAVHFAAPTAYAPCSPLSVCPPLPGSCAACLVSCCCLQLLLDRAVEVATGKPAVASGRVRRRSRPRRRLQGTAGSDQARAEGGPGGDGDEEEEEEDLELLGDWEADEAEEDDGAEEQQQQEEEGESGDAMEVDGRAAEGDEEEDAAGGGAPGDPGAAILLLDQVCGGLGV